MMSSTIYTLKIRNMSNKLGDYDVWYQPCEKCGYDTGKSTIPKEGNKTCWKWLII